MTRRHWAMVDREVCIDEMIRHAERWDKLRLSLNKALTRLPDDAYDFVVKNVSFHAGHNQVISVKEQPKPNMIILERNASQSQIAHEIAHAFLGHNRENSIERDIDGEAESLRKKWGFKEKNICPHYPDGCRDCKNYHCSDSPSFKFPT
jgi:hypothetical protein